MNRSELETYFSKERLHNFFQQYPNNDPKCIYLYVANKQISESFYTSLAVLEISLRNAIHKELTRKYKKKDWYLDFQYDNTCKPLWKDVDIAIKKIVKKGKTPTAGKVVAELNFGFWTALFNARYEKKLWKSLRFIFPNLPKHLRQRRTISVPLNNIREDLRNRVYHYEPIIWNIQNTQKLHSDILKVLNWMDPKLNHWLQNIDRFPTAFANAQKQLNTL